MLMTRIHKPALLRRVFELGCIYTGQVVSYQQMLGQLQDAGNAATLAHYLELLSGAGLVSGLQKFSLNRLQQKASSPKFQVLNAALKTAQNRFLFETTKQNRVEWQKLIECAVGAHLLNASFGTKIETFYWKENNKHVDFILEKDKNLTVIEVNNPQKGKNVKGLDIFIQKYQPTKIIFVGEGGISVEEFLLSPLEAWI
jgi:predicted AAA+ superfamily ATPase